jgi:hypothetical protein
VLQWLAFSARPLHVREVAEVIAIDVEGDGQFDEDEILTDPLDVITICSSLVTVNMYTLHVRLAHFSVQEYLLSTRIQLGMANFYTIQPITANIFIAQACLVYLLRFEEISPLEKLHGTDLFNYAANYWTLHASRSQQDGAASIYRFAKRIFSARNALWNSVVIRKSLSKIEKNELLDPMAFVIQSGLLDIARLLLQEPDIKVRKRCTASGETPLHLASKIGNEKLVELLISAGADMNAIGGDYGTALQLASVEGNLGVVKVLLAAGADTDLQAGHYGTALQAAVAGRHEDIVLMLLNARADINAECGWYGSALGAAFMTRNKKLEELLLSAGAMKVKYMYIVD